MAAKLGVFYCASCDDRVKKVAGSASRICQRCLKRGYAVVLGVGAVTHARRIVGGVVQHRFACGLAPANNSAWALRANTSIACKSCAAAIAAPASNADAITDLTTVERQQAVAAIQYKLHDPAIGERAKQILKNAQVKLIGGRAATVGDL